MDINEMKLKDVSEETLRKYLETKDKEEAIQFDYLVNETYKEFTVTTFDSSDYDNCKEIIAVMDGIYFACWNNDDNSVNDPIIYYKGEIKWTGIGKDSDYFNYS